MKMKVIIAFMLVTLLFTPAICYSQQNEVTLHYRMELRANVMFMNINITIKDYTIAMKQVDNKLYLKTSITKDNVVVKCNIKEIEERLKESLLQALCREYYIEEGSEPEMGLPSPTIGTMGIAQIKKILEELQEMGIKVNMNISVSDWKNIKAYRILMSISSKTMISKMTLETLYYLALNGVLLEARMNMNASQYKVHLELELLNPEAISENVQGKLFKLSIGEGKGELYVSGNYRLKSYEYKGSKLTIRIKCTDRALLTLILKDGINIKEAYINEKAISAPIIKLNNDVYTSFLVLAGDKVIELNFDNEISNVSVQDIVEKAEGIELPISTTTLLASMIIIMTIMILLRIRKTAIT